MSAVELVQLTDATLRGADCTFDPGVQVVLGTERDGTHALASLIAGLSRPRRGSVRIAGTDPYRSPETRRRVGTLLGVETPPSAPSVEAAIGAALRLRRDPLDSAALLAQFGLSGIRSARPDRIPNDVWRDLVLALALTVPNALGLVLVEPLSTGLGRELVRDRLSALAAANVCVIALTASSLEAAELGGSIVLLDQGRFVRRPGSPLALELAPGGTLVLRVRAQNARGLAGRLAQDPSVAGLDWHSGGDELSVSGSDPDALALAIARGAREVDANITAIEPMLPGLDEARAASAGLWKASYEAAYRAGQAHGRARAEAWRAAQARASEAPPSIAPSAPPPSSLPPSGGTP